MRLSEGFLSGTCFHCGEEVRQGGIWHGIGQEVTLCSDYKCTKALIHLAIDALQDASFLGEPYRNLSRSLKGMTEESLKEKKPR